MPNARFSGSAGPPSLSPRSTQRFFYFYSRHLCDLMTMRHDENATVVIFDCQFVSTTVTLRSCKPRDKMVSLCLFSLPRLFNFFLFDVSAPSADHRSSIIAHYLPGPSRCAIIALFVSLPLRPFLPEQTSKLEVEATLKVYSTLHVFSPSVCSSHHTPGRAFRPMFPPLPCLALRHPITTFPHPRSPPLCLFLSVTLITVRNTHARYI